jgi:FkbM family methyltransferase
MASNGSSIDLLPLLIEHSALVEGKRAILQIGANDGHLRDPVHQIIMKLSLLAILVEPLPDRFEQLRRNYSNQSNIRFENVAVSTQPGEGEIFRISKEAAHLPDWMQGIASFDKSHLLKHKSYAQGALFDPYIESVRVPVVTINQLLQKNSDITEFIALQVDTEGHDFVVIKSAVEARFLPKIINYEHKHLAYSDQVSCRELLSSLDYSFWADQVNTIAYRTVSG